ncbi:FemAB family XrtA/PEP-CTERM system-associated protein [Pseudoduganella buxea]|uniref:FemAB family PEP-CTERM system-associated protein n=1 Tax=Pseudoduganella buxea TaxID=1949069 RepID=A0A6I3T007_9BURK|nr:FemAB family XrtA/PEP-CTERM system-associated protein [Pseudoduganella buxea]MTV54684.1 FemAB family PEP-CTERM system-associated protein [Pseudoduganella buxea]GGC16926.1 peptidoglycan bridge formation protein FemAB [Pseudoduganella buxea]
MSAIIEAAMERAREPASVPDPVPGPVTVRLLRDDAQDRARWDAFVYTCPQASFFHRAGWQRVIEHAFGHRTWFHLAEQDGAIVGVLPLAQIKSRLFGHSLIALPFCVYGGVAAVSDAAQRELDAAALALAASLGAGHLEYRNYTPAHPGDPAWQGKELYVTFRKAIGADDEENMNAIPRKQRAMVRKGIKCGLTGEVDDDVERFFVAYSNSVHRLGTPVFSKKYFALLKQEFANDCEVRVIVKDGQLVAGVLSFFFRDEVLPYYGGGMPVARDVAGNDFMYWNLMQASAARGCRLFDFGRSKVGTGAFDFKKNWGFTAQPLPYEYHLVTATAIPDVNPLNPKYQLFIKLWQKLPLALANALGPHIVKDLG